MVSHVHERRDVKSQPSGYIHHRYAESLSEFGVPYELPKSHSWILKRPITGTPYYDGMGCYPLFCCENWPYLKGDLDDVMVDFVTLSIVTDPFGGYDERYLKACFPDICKPFKQHYVTDLSLPAKSFVSGHHQRNARKACEKVRVEVSKTPAAYLYQWVVLYSNLIVRHDITGLTAFSKKAFETQLQVPGIIAMRAEYEGQTVGMLLWYVQREIAYYHLGAYSDLGYELKSSFALFSKAIEYFASLGVLWLSLGAGPGLNDEAEDGLSRFKRGWSSGTRLAYFCGRIFDRRRNDAIMSARRISKTDYFPAYRAGEFS
jgi:hypothetical protein